MKTKPIKAPKNWRDLKPHPLSTLTEFGAGVDMEAFAASVKEHGYDQAESIIVLDGMILDGRHKHAVCIKLDITPSFAVFMGKNPVAFVCKKIFRQHLNESQRAMIAARFAQLPVGANQHTGKEEGAQICAPSLTVEEAAKALNVSEGSVESAKVVTAKGSPELIEKVASGEKKVSTAAAEVKAASRFCPRCQRVGPIPSCAACADLSNKPAKPKKPAKVGAEKFSMKDFESDFGRVVRQIDKLGNAYEQGRSAEKERIHDLLGVFFKAFGEWHKKLTKGK